MLKLELQKKAKLMSDPSSMLDPTKLQPNSTQLKSIKDRLGDGWGCTVCIRSGAPTWFTS